MSERLKDTLTEHWPPERVRVECAVCGERLYDTYDHEPAIHAASYITKVIEILIRKHGDETGHLEIDIGIDARSEPVLGIDCEITVNEK